MEKYKEIERSIIKKFRKEIWSRFIRGLKDYDLVNEGDKIAVCMSGGKDSTLLAKCMQELKRHGKIPFELEFIIMDPGYNELNRRIAEENFELLNIPAKVFESRIFDIVAGLNDGSPCYLCARMRRGFLYDTAKKLGCNKIALGHHFDDVIETILISMFYGGELKTMMPKLHSTNFEGMQLIRPLYLVKEESIIAWKNYNGLSFLNCACRFTENLQSCELNENGSKRSEIKSLIKNLRQTSPFIENNIFRSVENVHINAIIGYKKNGEKHNFMDNY